MFTGIMIDECENDEVFSNLMGLNKEDTIERSYDIIDRKI